MADSAFKLTGADAVIGLLNKLPAEVVSKRGGPVRRALRKGGKIILDEEVRQLKESLDPDASGLLAENVVLTRGKAPNDGKGERYLVRIKRKVYPNRGRIKVRGGKLQITTTLQTAQLKEWGSEKQQAEPFIVPTVKAKGRAAIDAATKALVSDLNRIVKRLAKGR